MTREGSLLTNMLSLVVLGDDVDDDNLGLLLLLVLVAVVKREWRVLLIEGSWLWLFGFVS